MTIRRMRFARWLPKANKYTQYVTQRFPTTTVVVRTRLNVTLYVHIPSCFHLALSWHMLNSTFFLASNKFCLSLSLSVRRRNACTLQYIRTKQNHIIRHRELLNNVFFFLRLSNGYHTIWHALIWFMCLWTTSEDCHQSPHEQQLRINCQKPDKFNVVALDNVAALKTNRSLIILVPAHYRFSVACCVIQRLN